MQVVGDPHGSGEGPALPGTEASGGAVSDPPAPGSGGLAPLSLTFLLR